MGDEAGSSHDRWDPANYDFWGLEDTNIGGLAIKVGLYTAFYFVVFLPSEEAVARYGGAISVAFGWVIVVIFAVLKRRWLRQQANRRTD